MTEDLISMADWFEDISIRNFTIDDYDVVIEFWELSEAEYHPQGRDTRERIAKEIKGDCAIFLIAEIKGKIVGTIFCTHDGRKGWMNRLAVHPEIRRSGLGSILIQEGERRLRERGIRVIAAMIWESNYPSRMLFEKEGYELRRDALYYVKKDFPDI